MIKGAYIKNKDFIEININKNFWFSVSAVYIILISGIVFAIDPSIYGHDSSEINGITWANNVGEITYSNTPLEGGHSTSELQDIVWFNESEYYGTAKRVGTILKQNSSSQASTIIEVSQDNGVKITYIVWGGTRYLNAFNKAIDHTLWIDVYVNGNYFSSVSNQTIAPNKTDTLSLSSYISTIQGANYRYVFSSMYNPSNTHIKNSKQSLLWIDCWSYSGATPLSLVHRQQVNQAWFDI